MTPEDQAREELAKSVALAATTDLVTVPAAQQLIQNRDRTMQNAAADLSAAEISDLTGLTEQRVEQITGRPQTGPIPDPLTPEALKDSPDSPTARIPEGDV